MKKIELDITKYTCPLTFVKVKIELSKMDPGDILEVLLTDGQPLKNVPRSCEEQGYKVLDISHKEDDVYKVTIEK